MATEIIRNLILRVLQLWPENKDRRFIAFDRGVANKDRICIKKASLLFYMRILARLK